MHEVIPAEPAKKHVAGLYFIIVMKFLKCLLFVTLAIVMYCLSDNDLPAEFARLMEFLRVHPGNQFFQQLAVKVGQLTEANILWAAAGTFIYSLFSLVEGIGLSLRVGWAGWLAIGESAFFIPIEIFELLRHFKWPVFVVLVLNIFIVEYLYRHRHRLFRHHHH